MRITLIAALAALSALGVSMAQDDAARVRPVDTEAAQRLKAYMAEKAETRPRLKAPPLGERARGSVRAEVDWAELDRIIAITQRRLEAARASSLSVARAPTAFVQPDGIRVLSPDRVLREAAPEAARVTMPVLVPATEEVLSTLQVFGQADAYSAIATAAPGVDLRISGSRKKLLVPRTAMAERLLRKMRASRPPLPGVEAEYVITRSESSTDLSFSKFGCGYVISLMCDDPDGDARCTEDDFIIELASSMALLSRTAEDDQ